MNNAEISTTFCEKGKWGHLSQPQWIVGITRCAYSGRRSLCVNSTRIIVFDLSSKIILSDLKSDHTVMTRLLRFWKAPNVTKGGKLKRVRSWRLLQIRRGIFVLQNIFIWLYADGKSSLVELHTLIYFRNS
ncbi:hypothetical protein Rs2_29474 [Raphanus sativus]|nr:hypothetical protein Rs2_29474 [Raphanus sativus]